jgi:uncharacterized membrane protein
MPVVIFISALALILFFLGWALIAWEQKSIRKQKMNPLSRETALKGSTSNWTSRWPASAAVSLILFTHGCSEILHPSKPPFRRTTNSLIYQNLGEYGLAVTSLVLATLMMVAAYFIWRKGKQGQ